MFCNHLAGPAPKRTLVLIRGARSCGPAGATAAISRPGFAAGLALGGRLDLAHLGDRPRRRAPRAARPSRRRTLITFSRRSSRPATSANERRPHRQAAALVDRRGHDHVATPTSSSSSMKTIPFAVAGRWRATTRPAIRISRAVGEHEQVVAARRGRRPSSRAQDLDRVLAEGDAGRGVVGDDPLPGVERAQVGRRGEGERQRQLAWRARATARRRARPPGARARRAAAPSRRDGRAARRRRPRRAARGSSRLIPEREARSARSR